VVAPPLAYTSQDASGVLSDGSPCPGRVRKSLSMRAHSCPCGGRLLDRDHHATAVILQHGPAVARADCRWPQRTSEARGTVGRTGTETPGDSWAPAAG
jgi:hypothetical protein